VRHHWRLLRWVQCQSTETRNSVTAEGLHDTLCQLKSCQLLHNCRNKLYNNNTHTHTRLTAPFPGLPRWVGTRKVKPIWSKRMWVAVASAGRYASLHLLQTDNHTSTPTLCFLQAGCPSCRPTNITNRSNAVMADQCVVTSHGVSTVVVEQAWPLTSFVDSKINLLWGKLSKSRIWDKVPEGSTLIFGGTQISLKKQCRIGRRKLPCQKPAQFVHPKTIPILWYYFLHIKFNNITQKNNEQSTVISLCLAHQFIILLSSDKIKSIPDWLYLSGTSLPRLSWKRGR